MDFGSIPEQRRSPTLLYTLLIMMIVIAGLFFFVQNQKKTRTSASDPSPVPGILRPGEPNFEYYKDRVRLDKVRATLGINFAKSRIAIVSGIIVNDGDRKLEALELQIALYDKYDRLSVKRTKTPLRPGIGIKRSMEPLEKRSFTVWIEPIEQLWNPRRVDIEITGIKYQ